ncbi:protein kinase family protein [Streptomyces microflavus]|uniref:hypothetical protein n=1 Tax=Streptomyces microflavus TaxID=1919 RepID=UPI003811F8BF
MAQNTGPLVAGRYRLRAPAPPDTDGVGVIADDEALGTEATVLIQRVALPEVLTPDDGGAPHGQDPGIALSQDAARIGDTVRGITQLPQHRNLGVVHDIVPDRGSLWLVQEHIEHGKPLSAALARRPLDPYRAAEIASDVLRALRHLHQLGWHHGNITPQTVWLDDSGSAILTGLDQAVINDLVCGISRSMPMPPAPAPPAGRASARTPSRPATTRPPAPVRFTAVGGIAGGVRADAYRNAGSAPQPIPAMSEPRAEAGPPLTVAHPVPPPVTPLEAERAQHLRMLTVGYVVERWAPEQASLSTEATPFLAPVGPTTDLWALGALLFRAVTGRPPYPELDDTAELLDMVRSEPPAYAEGTGALRPLIEKLLSPDPLKRPSTEELLRWIASIQRDAPEPFTIIPAREPAPASGTSLILRFRGPLAWRDSGVMTTSRSVHRRGRHRRPSPRRRIPPRTVTLITLTAATALTLIVYTTPRPPRPDHTPANGQQLPPPPPTGPSPPPDAHQLVVDPAGFTIATAPGARRHATPRTVEYRHNGITVTVVPGHDTLHSGETPLDYQRRQPELAVVRADPSSTASGLRLTTIGESSTTAEGTYRFAPPGGPPTYVRNRVSVLAGKLHVLQVSGPGARQEEVDDVYVRAAGSYQLTPAGRQPGTTPPARTTPSGGRRGRRAPRPGVNDGENLHRVRAQTRAEDVPPTSRDAAAVRAPQQSALSARGTTAQVAR